MSFSVSKVRNCAMSVPCLKVQYTYQPRIFSVYRAEEEYYISAEGILRSNPRCTYIAFEQGPDLILDALGLSQQSLVH